MKLITLKFLTIFIIATLLSNNLSIKIKKATLPEGTAFGYASNENILQNSAVKIKYINNKILGIQRTNLYGENPYSFK